LIKHDAALLQELHFDQVLKLLPKFGRKFTKRFKPGRSFCRSDGKDLPFPGFGILNLDAYFLCNFFNVLKALSRSGSGGFVAALKLFVLSLEKFYLIDQFLKTHIILPM